MSRALVGLATLLLAGSGSGVPTLGAGDDPRARESVEWLLDARALRSLSMDLLGRPPLRSEVSEWIGKPAARYLDQAVGGREFWQRWLDEQLYYFLLVNNFRPRSERIQQLPDDLAAHKLDAREAIHLVALSSNFDQRNPGADTFVTVVLEQLDGMEVQKNTRELEIGKRVYDGREGVFLGSRGNCQADVVRIAIEHPAFARHFAGREHLRLVHREPDPKEWATSATELHKDPAAYTLAVRRWLASDAYRARLETRVPVSNRLFVCALFVDLFDRVPTVDEGEPMREALDGLSDPTPLRAILVRMLIDSGKVPIETRESIPDPAAWIGGLFPRLLGRPATESEIATFVEAFRKSECRPQTILSALLTSAEYQRY